jgi:hypothetical protein
MTTPEGAGGDPELAAWGLLKNVACVLARLMANVRDSAGENPLVGSGNGQRREGDAALRGVNAASLPRSRHGGGNMPIVE